jgi:hypothetical protein
MCDSHQGPIPQVRSYPLQVVCDLIKSKFAEADCTLFFGSAAKGIHTATSDIDLIVLYKQLPIAKRETFIQAGWLVEVQHHDPETLNYVMSADARHGSAVVPTMVIESIPLPLATDLYSKVLNRARAIFDAGPPRLDLSGSRYVIANMLDDLRREQRNLHETIAILAELYKALALYYLREKGQWLVSKQMIPRAIAKLDPALEQEFCTAFRRCCMDGNPADVLKLGDRLLLDFGDITNIGVSWSFPKSQRLELPA